MGKQRTLKVRIYGSFDVTWDTGETVDIRGSKVRALFLMLVTSPHGSHARAMLQSTLWEGASLAQAQASLRRALSDLRAAFGENFETLFTVDNYTVGIDMEQIEQIGSPNSGAFLEGLSVRGTQFQKWLDARRSATKKSAPARALRPANSALPCIAVAPLRMISVDDDDPVFAEYLTSMLTRGLAHRRYFDVISHLSGRLLDVKNDSMEAMREALGVDFLVYGNIIEKPDSYQLKVDCADAATGNVLWSGGVTGQKATILEDRSQVLNDLVRQVSGALLNACSVYAQSAPLPDIPLPTLLLSATALLHHPGRDGFMRAKLQFDCLISRAPDQSLFRAMRARWHMDAIAQQWTDNPNDDAMAAIQNSYDCAQLNPRCLHGLVINGLTSLWLKDDLAMAEDHFFEACHIDPYHPDALAGLAQTHARQGDYDRAIELAHDARRAAVGSPYRYVFYEGLAGIYWAQGELSMALQNASTALQDHRYHLGAHCLQVQALYGLGRHEEAVRAARSLMTRHPRFSVERYRQRQAALNNEIHDSALVALRQSNIPDGRISVAAG